ncbi:hypothetical protein ABFS83_02G048800 [Erythranthe nasuta]
MEVSSCRSLTDMGMEDLLFCQQWPNLDSIFDDLSSVSIDSILFEDFNQSHSYCNNSQLPDLKRGPAPEWSYGENITRPTKQVRPENESNAPPPTVKKPKQETWYSSTNRSNTITFGQQQNNYVVPKSYEHAKCTTIPTKSTTTTTTTTTSTATTTRVPSAQERMLAERKRRENLTQRFIALSALVPGLKKMDKASVLGDAIKYMKQLQDKVKILEEQQANYNKRNAESSLVFVEKYKLDHADNPIKNPSSSDESMSGTAGPTTKQSPVIPEIETRMCNKDVLIHIHCERKKDVLEKTVVEVEKLDLSVVNSSFVTFGDSALNISLVAQMDEEFTSDMNKELVKNLHEALSKYSSEK